jgi:hypothetical protein
MSVFTNADDLFREIRDTDSMLLDLIANAPSDMWHWPSYYLLYVEVDRLWWLLQDTQYSIAHPLIDTDPLEIAERIALINDNFSQIGQRQCAIIDWLSLLLRHMHVEKEDLTCRLRAHIQPKSDWYQGFHQRYCAGRISGDGKTLTRTIFLFDPQARHRIYDLAAIALEQEQVFDLSTAQSREDLGTAVSNTQRLHAQALSAMLDFFVRHCTIEALAHPTSM